MQEKSQSLLTFIAKLIILVLGKIPRKEIVMKICSSCNKTKDNTEFRKRKDRKAGLTSQCKECLSQSYKHWYRENRINKIRSINKRSSRQIEESKKRSGYYQRPDVKLKRTLRWRVWSILKKNKNDHKTLNLLGCSLEQLKTHLISTAINNGYSNFALNMIGKNFHIDHIRPCSSFNFKNENDVKECFNFKNLQILDMKRNLKKGKSW